MLLDFLYKNLNKKKNLHSMTYRSQYKNIDKSYHRKLFDCRFCPFLYYLYHRRAEEDHCLRTQNIYKTKKRN